MVLAWSSNFDTIGFIVIAYSCPLLKFVWDVFTPNDVSRRFKSKKDPLYAETRRLATRLENQSSSSTCARGRKS